MSTMNVISHFMHWKLHMHKGMSVFKKTKQKKTIILQNMKT